MVGEVSESHMVCVDRVLPLAGPDQFKLIAGTRRTRWVTELEPKHDNLVRLRFEVETIRKPNYLRFLGLICFSKLKS